MAHTQEYVVKRTPEMTIAGNRWQAHPEDAWRENGSVIGAFATDLPPGHELGTAHPRRDSGR